MNRRRMPQAKDPKGNLLKIGHTHAALLERDVRVADLAPTVRASALQLVQASDAEEKARWEQALAREVKEHTGRVLAEEIRLAELDTRIAVKGYRDAAMYRALFPAGLGGFARGRSEARVRKVRTLVESLASTTGGGERGESLGAALGAHEEALAAWAEARRKRIVAVQVLAQAREAFVNQYRLGLAAVITRLGDRRAASAFFPSIASPSAPDGCVAPTPVSAATSSPPAVGEPVPSSAG